MRYTNLIVGIVIMMLVLSMGCLNMDNNQSSPETTNEQQQMNQNDGLSAQENTYSEGSSDGTAVKAIKCDYTQEGNGMVASGTMYMEKDKYRIDSTQTKDGETTKTSVILLNKGGSSVMYIKSEENSQLGENCEWIKTTSTTEDTANEFEKYSKEDLGKEFTYSSDGYSYKIKCVEYTGSEDIFNPEGNVCDLQNMFQYN